MGQPAAKQGDQVMATDIHIVMIPSPGGPIPTPLPHPFAGLLDGSLSQNVNVQGMPAAVQGSTATNTPAHIPQGGPFQSPPKNQATVQLGSSTVKINGKAAARNGDTCMTCNDPSDVPGGTIIAVSTVMVGG
jgi:uncharacterized Zn-binding protein involved in type VI secretion